MALNPTGGRISIIQKFIEVLHYKAQLYATVGAAAALVGMYLWTIHGCPALRPLFADPMQLRYNPSFTFMHQTIYRILVWSR